MIFRNGVAFGPDIFPLSRDLLGLDQGGWPDAGNEQLDLADPFGGGGGQHVDRHTLGFDKAVAGDEQYAVV